MSAFLRYVKLGIAMGVLTLWLSPPAFAQFDDEADWEESPFQEALRQGESAYEGWKLEDAEREFRRALTLVEGEPEGDRPYALAYTRVSLSRVLDAMHREEDALEVHELVIESLLDPASHLDDEDRADALREHAGLLMQLGRWDEAETLTDRSFKHAQAYYGENEPWALSYLGPKIAILMQTERQGEAIGLHKRLIDAYEKAFGRTNPGLLGVLNSAAYDAAIAGDPEQALDWFQRILDLNGNEHHESSQELANSYEWVAIENAETGDLDRAVESMYKSIDLLERAFGDNNRNIANNYAVLATLQAAAGELEDAAKSLDKALENIGDGERHDWLLIDVLIHQSSVLRLLDRGDEADKALERARALIAH